MWYLGVDGGGTKTRFVLFDADMVLRREFRLPTCHPTQVGYEGMRAVLLEGLGEIERMRNAPFGIGYGLAGYGQDSDVRKRMDMVVREVSQGRPHVLVNDVEAAWAASHKGRDGIVSICGTGSIAYGCSGDRSMRCGGWGYRVGDEGSGYWLGKEALRLFSRQADGRDPRGPLFEVVMEHLGFCHPHNVIAYACDELRGERTRIAALAPLLAEAARSGDAPARLAFASAARELSDLVRTICAGLFEGASDRVPVACVGGVFDGAPDLLRDELAAMLPPRCDLVDCELDLAAGPCVLLRRRLADKAGRDR